MAKRPSRKAGTSSSGDTKFPGITSYKDRHGRVRYRIRKGDRTVNLGTDYGSPEFVARYREATGGEGAERSSQAPQGTLSSVIEGWYTSPEFQRLGPSTKYNYRNIAEGLREEYGEQVVSHLTRQNVKAIMAKKATTPHAANNQLRILRLVLDYAVDVMELIEHNPAREVKKYEGYSEGHHTWSDEEIDLFFQHHPIGSTADLAMALMLYTGASRADVVGLGPKNVKNGRLQYMRQKMKSRGGVQINIPVHPELEKRLELVPAGHATFLQTVQGKPRSPNGLGNLMRQWCDAVQDEDGNSLLPDCTSHGLRKACARRLAEAGATPHEIMAVTGHKTLSEVERYTSKVSRASLADSAFQREISRRDPQSE